MRLTPENLEGALERSLARRPGVTLRLDIVNKCNLRCVMCYYSDDAIFKRPAWKLTPEEFRGFFEDIAPQVVRVVLSCGDEPLVSNHFPAILSYLGDEHPELEIEFCTNGMLMNARVRRLLIEKGVTHLLLSMDGVTAQTLESIRVGSKYQRLVANILALRDLKRAAGSEFPVLVMDYVMMHRNIHEAPAFVEASARFGARLIDFRHVIPSEWFDEPEELLENHPAKYNHYRKAILAAGRRHGIDLVLPPAFDTSETWEPSEASAAGLEELDRVALDRVAPDAAKGEVPVPKRFPRGFKARNPRGTAAEQFAGTYCERPFSEIFIADRDKVKPCTWHRTHLGTLGEDGSLSDIFFGPEFTRLRRNMLRPEGDPNCAGCVLKSGQLSSETAQFGARSKRFLRQLAGWLRG